MSINWTEGQERPSALIVTKRPEGIDLPLLIHPNPRLAFTIILRHMYPSPEMPEGISQRSSDRGIGQGDESVGAALGL